MTAPDPHRADPRRHGLPPRGADRGLITLEWLLIVGAIAGLAASTVLVVQNVVDDTSHVPADPLVRLLQADVEAAFVAAEAQSVFDESITNPLIIYNDASYQDLCVVDLALAASTMSWRAPHGRPLLTQTAFPATRTMRRRGVRSHRARTSAPRRRRWTPAAQQAGSSPGNSVPVPVRPGGTRMAGPWAAA